MPERLALRLSVRLDCEFSKINIMKTGKLIHVRKAAQILSCTERHIYNMIKSGMLGAVKLGVRGTRITEESIGDFVGRTTTTTTKR
jgi:excisionase family DNA binding protein